MFHKLILVGNLGRDPEMRFTPAGDAVTSFSLAVNNYSRVNGERVKQTIWFNVSAFGKTAELCNNFLNSGSKVMITARLRPDPATGAPRIYNRNDGTPGTSYDVVVDEVVFLGSRREDSPGDDEIPF